MKNPFMPRMAPRDRNTPNTFGEDVAVKMSQRTLILILMSTIAIAGAYFDLKSDARSNHDAVVDLIAIRASDVVERKADRDLLIKAVQGVEALQRRADWQDRRASRDVTTAASHP